MDLGLQGKLALVTASSGGIGRCVVEALAREGCGVIVHGRSPHAVQEVAQRLEAGGHVETLLGDVEHDLARLEAAIKAKPLDILVNMAGPFSEHDWRTVRTDDWLGAYRGNVIAAARLSQAALPAMKEKGWGRIVNIGSRAVRTPLPNMVAYSAAKAAVVNMTTSLARSLANTGITANVVSPGVILTDGLRQMFLSRLEHRGAQWEDIEPQVAAEYAPNPSGRLGRPEDIASAVAFLCGKGAGYVNGVEIRVDGGITGTP
jgi:NAD(P)-dependent dehydrogenase (short-subunit alcohol dehydrogenase family)